MSTLQRCDAWNLVLNILIVKQHKQQKQKLAASLMELPSERTKAFALSIGNNTWPILLYIPLTSS
eukprot:gene2609-8099_t